MLYASCRTNADNRLQTRTTYAASASSLFLTSPAGGRHCRVRAGPEVCRPGLPHPEVVCGRRAPGVQRRPHIVSASPCCPALFRKLPVFHSAKCPKCTALDCEWLSGPTACAQPAAVLSNRCSDGGALGKLPALAGRLPGRCVTLAVRHTQGRHPEVDQEEDRAAGADREHRRGA